MKGGVLCDAISETPHDACHVGPMTAAVVRVGNTANGRVAMQCPGAYHVATRRVPKVLV